MDENVKAAIELVKVWLAQTSTWDEDLDGFDRRDCCEATLRRLIDILSGKDGE